MKRICKECGKIIESISRRVYCSDECYKQHVKKANRVQPQRIEKACKCCGRLFVQYSTPGKPKSFCSERCMWRYYKANKNKQENKYDKPYKVMEGRPNFIAESLDYEMCSEGAALLASAIIESAASDYKRAVKHHLATYSFRRFFLGEWFQTLTMMTRTYCDGNKVVELIEGGLNAGTTKHQIGRRGSGMS